MSHLGKIFIYEQNPETLNQFAAHLESQGFFAFGTDNIYLLLKYAASVAPDVVIMNMPHDFEADNTFWKIMHENLCHEKCPQIFINAKPPKEDDNSFYYTDFHSKSVPEGQILDLIQKFKN